jgi:hypothetical protein
VGVDVDEGWGGILSHSDNGCWKRDDETGWTPWRSLGRDSALGLSFLIC